MSQALRDLVRSETDRLKDAGLYKREVVFSRSSSACRSIRNSSKRRSRRSRSTASGCRRSA
jgi:hypothetical protein